LAQGKELTGRKRRKKHPYKKKKEKKQKNTLDSYRPSHGRAQRQIKTRPELRDGYLALIRKFVTWNNLPWVVMGVGCIIGKVPSVFSFFRPRDGNPYVLAFFGSIFLLWGLITYWLGFQGGAQTLADCPGLMNFNFRSPRMVMAFWFLCLAGGIFAVFMLFTQDVPLLPLSSR
jgi:hypothetical protein